MRKKIVVATTAGVLALTGLAVAVPALAHTDRPSGGASSVERITDALSGLVDGGSLTQEQAHEVATTLSEAGMGSRGGHPGGRLDLGTAATALDMTEDELRTALRPEGTTLADIAAERDVDVAALVEALVQAQEERLAEAVGEGRLSQEEADERLADLEERVTARIDSDDWGGRGHGGPGRGHRDGD